jgi:hypothetical protein
MTGRDLLKLVRRTQISEATLDAIEEQIRARRRGLDDR